MDRAYASMRSLPDLKLPLTLLLPWSQGEGRSKKAAEHNAADKAYTFIRSVPGLKLPSGSLSLGSAPRGAGTVPTLLGGAGATGLDGANAATAPATPQVEGQPQRAAASQGARGA